MKEKLFLSAIAIAVTGMLSAATLNVELTVSHGIYSGVGELAASKKVVFLVIDRSGSMSDKSLPGGRTPNEALLESLKLQLDALPFGTEIHVLPFSSRVHEETVYPSLDAKTRKSILNFVMGSVPNGQTLLYDAQDKALSAAAKIMTENANAEVRMLVYTDGEHLTPWNYEGEYKACFQRKAGGLGRKKFENNPSYQQERAAAKKKFEARWHDLKAMPRMAVEYEWLSSSQKPEEEMVDGTPIDTEFSSRLKDYRLKNPLVEPLQDLKCRLHLPITDDMWQEVVGKNVSLDFDVGGKRVSKVLVLKEGANVCKLEWPSLPENKPTTVCLALSRMPSGKKFILNKPKPIVMTVPAQACLAVTIESPAKEGVAPVFSTGADVTFRAKASEPDAEIKWAVGKSEVLKGYSVNWQPKSPGSVTYSVTASKAGFRSAEAKGSFEVIPTGVTLESASARHEVSRESVFRATAIGPCIRYEWTVDDKRVSGETAEIKHVFDKSGSHKVCVRAIYKAGIVAEARPIEISVDAAPFVKILSPMAYDGDAENVQLQAEKPIALLARVEGGLTTVSWQFKMKDKVSTVQTVIKDGQTAGQYVPLKGGFYDVVATGKGPAGEASDTVQVFVKSTEVQIGIESPRANQDVATGKPFDLVAAVKGPVKNVRWKMTNKSTGMSVNFGELDVSPVVDGKSTPISAKMPLELGNACVEITAEPIFDDEELSDAVAPASVTVDAVTEASIIYTPETLKENWKRAKFGSQVALGVEVSGAIKKVAWFTIDLDGKEKKLEKEGASINIDVPAVSGQSECHVDYLAKGLMPDGSWMSADQRLTIVACCPCRLAGEGCGPKIELPKTNGITRTSYGLKEPVQAEVGLSGDYELVDMAWDMGDKTTYAAKVANHPGYDAYGKYVISATGKCKVCGCNVSVSPVEVAVEPQPITAEFAIRPFASSTKTIAGRVAQGRQVVLVGMDSPDIARREWTCNGLLLKDENGNPMTGAAIEFRCTDVGDVEFGQTVFDTKGNAIGPVTHKLRVYRLWVVVVAFLAALLVSGLYWWYFSGDDPRFWKVYVRVDETNSMNAQSVEADMASGPGLIRYWDTMRNRATIPLSKLGGKQSDDWSVGTVLGQTSLMIWESTTAADGRGVRMPNCSLLNPPDGMEKESLSKGQLIHIWAPSPSDPKAVTALWVKIKMRAAPNTFLWLRFGILLLCLGLAVAISYFFAF